MHGVLYDSQLLNYHAPTTQQKMQLLDQVGRLNFSVLQH